jgi:hypothetical protein
MKSEDLFAGLIAIILWIAWGVVLWVASGAK